MGTSTTGRVRRSVSEWETLLSPYEGRWSESSSVLSRGRGLPEHVQLVVPEASHVHAEGELLEPAVERLRGPSAGGRGAWRLDTGDRASGWHHRSHAGLEFDVETRRSSDSSVPRASGHAQAVRWIDRSRTQRTTGRSVERDSVPVSESSWQLREGSVLGSYGVLFDRQAIGARSFCVSGNARAE